MLGENGYPRYRRRNNSIYTIKPSSGYRYTNSDVVPFNVYLLLRFNAYINIKYYTGFNTIKYVYKYVYKGANRAIVRIASAEETTRNKVKEYLNARYVSVLEGAFRI